ncbi:DUF1214 domain-containing protein [Kitasatospora sp. NPDC052868]|uniref:DUF1214 domain-containing protein n=1 Tax=Kitasatospora sp. NPDC052868 TaxID=3364060 RepID=UPI0037C80030
MHSFAYVGTRTGDTTGGDYLLAGPGWRGTVPDGITRVIAAPTPLVCLLARVTILDDDVPAAVALQQRIALRPADPLGLLANSAKEAYYLGAVLDGDGNPLSGEHRYELRFGPDDFPPVGAFWSVTMYLNPQDFLVENPIGRYHLGSLTKGLTYGPDGSLTLYLQRDNPRPRTRVQLAPHH